MEKEATPVVERRLEALPSIPLSVGAARSEGGEGLRGADAERLALSDQALAVMVLRVANSPLYGKVGAIVSVEAAVRHLGTAVVRRIAAGLAAAEANAPGVALDRPRYFEHYVAAAACCRVLARRFGCAPPEEAYTAGLLHSLGQAAFGFWNAKRYAEVLQAAAKGDRPLYEIERELLGSDHGRAGALLAEAWNLPTVLRDVILHHLAKPEVLQALPESSRTLVEVVAAVDSILSSSGLATCCRNGRKAPPVAGRTLTMDDVAVLMDAAREAWTDASLLLGIPEGEKPFAERVQEAEEAAAKRALPGSTVVAPRPRLEEAIAAVAESVRELRTLNTADEAWETALKGVRAALGVDRVLFFAYDAERARLDLRHAFDETGHIRPLEKPLADFALAAGGAMVHAIRDGLPTRVDDLGADIDFLRGVGVSQLAVAPVDLLEKTHGILTVDNVFSGRRIDSEDAALLGLLATEVGLAISNLLLQKQTQKLRALAERDELTGINNRRNLYALFQRELDRSRRYGSILSVAMVDIDFFKSFNDTYGHQAGDEVLRIISQVLVSASREIDIIGRYGGEEFVALLPETSLEQAKIYAERLRSRVELRGQDLRNRFSKTKPLTISVGVTQAMPQAGDDVERIIGRADEALYEAKEAGRNRIVVKQASESE
jgi:diguanylate cyclase (GGDEF)-like protein